MKFIGSLLLIDVQGSDCSIEFYILDVESIRLKVLPLAAFLMSDQEPNCVNNLFNTTRIYCSVV